MRVAILSDIHGNIDALSAVIADLPTDIQEIWILGDFVGYYYQVEKVLHLQKNYLC